MEEPSSSRFALPIGDELEEERRETAIPDKAKVDFIYYAPNYTSCRLPNKQPYLILLYNSTVTIVVACE